MNSKLPSKLKELKPRITVIGVGGAGGNAINNMIASGIDGVEFIAANTDAQALISSSAERRIQLGTDLTEGLGAGAKPEVGEAAAREAIEDIKAAVEGSHMVFIAAGMGGGTGTGAASVVARTSKDMGILTVAIVTKPFNFEGNKRQRVAEAGIEDLRNNVDTLIVIPNQNLFRIANERTTFAEAFLLADQVLHSGIACITDLIVREGLINLDFADVRAVMAGMGTAMMGTGEAAGERRAVDAAELAILNPLLDDVSLRGAKGLLVSISGSRSLTLYEVDEAASRVRAEVDPDANVIIGATFDESLADKIRVSIVASGLQGLAIARPPKSAAIARQPEPIPQLQPAPSHPVPQFPTAQQPVLQPPAWDASQDYPRYADENPPQAAEYATDYTEDGSGWLPEPAVDSARKSSWTAPNDVVIELGPPQVPQRAPAWNDERSDFEPIENSAPEFRPQAPHDVRRPQRRLPEVEDFAPFAQQAYRAKRNELPPPAPVAMPAPGRKRGGLFTFFTNRKESGAVESDSAFEPQRPQRQPPAVDRHDPASDRGDVPQRRIPMPRQRPRQG